jgi:hypothetical protein
MLTLKNDLGPELKGLNGVFLESAEGLMIRVLQVVTHAAHTKPPA